MHTKLLCQVLHRFDKAHASMVHQKANGIAIFAAAKAMEKLLAGADRERGGFFAVKRAQAHEISAAFFKLYITPDDVHNVGARQQFLDKSLGYRHR